MVLRVGEFLIDEAQCVIIYPDGSRQSLLPLQYRLLKYFIDNPRRIISKQELKNMVWERYVSDSSVNKAIYELRLTLNDDPVQPRYLVTRRKLGYVFVADVAPVETG